MLEAVVKAVLDRLSTPGDIGSSLLPGGAVFLLDAQVNILDELVAPEAGLGAAVVGLGVKKAMEALFNSDEDRLRRRIRRRAIARQAEEDELIQRRNLEQLRKQGQSDYSDSALQFCFRAAREMAAAGDIDASQHLSSAAVAYREGDITTEELLGAIAARYGPRALGG